MKKTLSDLLALKEQKCTPFLNAYIQLILGLADSYTKSDGIERIKAQLKNWDNDAQEYIIGEVCNEIISQGMAMFDEEEFRRALIIREK